MPQSAPLRNDELVHSLATGCSRGERVSSPRAGAVAIHSLQNLAGIEQTARISGPDRRGTGADGAVVSENANMSDILGAQECRPGPSTHPRIDSYFVRHIGDSGTNWGQLATEP